MGRKDTGFVKVLQENTLGRWQVKYIDMFVGRKIY